MSGADTAGWAGRGPWYKWWCIARLTWSRPAAVFWNMDNSQHNTKLVCDGVGFFCGSSPKRGQVVQCVVEIYVLLARPLVLVTCHPSWPDAGHRSHQHNLDIGIASLSPSRQQCRAGATNLNIINILARPAAFMKHILADKHPLTLFYYFWYFIAISVSFSMAWFWLDSFTFLRHKNYAFNNKEYTKNLNLKPTHGQNLLWTL